MLNRRFLSTVKIFIADAAQSFRDRWRRAQRQVDCDMAYKRALAIAEAADAVGAAEIIGELIRDEAFVLAADPADRARQIVDRAWRAADEAATRENQARLAEALVAAGSPELISVLIRAGYAVPRCGIAPTGRA